MSYLYKKILNAILESQKRQNWLFRTMLFGNEVYIRSHFLIFKPKTSLEYYRVPFTVSGIEYTIKKLDVSYLKALHDFFCRSVDTRSSEFVMPHKTDMGTLASIFKRRSYIP